MVDGRVSLTRPRYMQGSMIAIRLRLERQLIELDNVFHGHLVALFGRAFRENAVQHFLGVRKHGITVGVVTAPEQGAGTGVVASLDADLVVFKCDAEVLLPVVAR